MGRVLADRHGLAGREIRAVRAEVQRVAPNVADPVGGLGRSIAILGVGTATENRVRRRLFAVSTVDLSPRIVPIAEALIARSNGKYDPEFLCRLVADIAFMFEGAPVQDYVVVLVMKEATDALRKLDALQPRAA